MLYIIINSIYVEKHNLNKKIENMGIPNIVNKGKDRNFVTRKVATEGLIHGPMYLF